MGYFRLKPECYLVMGNKRAVLHDLIKKRSIWLTEEVANKLARAEKNIPFNEDGCEVFEALAADGWGIITDKEVFVDKFRPYNVFNEKKFHKNTPNIEIAVLQITNLCNQNCELCGKTFCPSCLRYDKDIRQLSFIEWKNVIDNLRGYGLKAVLLTGGEPALCEDLNKIVKYIKNNGIIVTIHTNGYNKLDKEFADCGKVISIFTEEGYSKAYKNYENEKNITLMIYDKSINVDEAIKRGWNIQNCTYDQTEIKKSDMGGIGVLKFYARKTYEDCMLNKIAISSFGDIYPCFGVKTKIGNVREMEMFEAVKILIEKYWVKSVEKRKTKCHMCEFRYSCRSCACFNPEEKCTYDVEEAKWI